MCIDIMYLQITYLISDDMFFRLVLFLGYGFDKTWKLVCISRSWCQDDLDSFARSTREAQTTLRQDRKNLLSPLDT